MERVVSPGEFQSEFLLDKSQRICRTSTRRISIASVASVARDIWTLVRGRRKAVPTKPKY